MVVTADHHLFMPLWMGLAHFKTGQPIWRSLGGLKCCAGCKPGHNLHVLLTLLFAHSNSHIPKQQFCKLEELASLWWMPTRWKTAISFTTQRHMHGSKLTTVHFSLITYKKRNSGTHLGRTQHTWHIQWHSKTKEEGKNVMLLSFYMVILSKD